MSDPKETDVKIEIRAVRCQAENGATIELTLSKRTHNDEPVAAFLHGSETEAFELGGEEVEALYNALGWYLGRTA